MTECPQHIKNRDGVIRAVRCRRWDCPTCGPLHAAHVIAASRTMDFDQLIGATFRADDFEKVWKRIRVRIPGLSYIAVIHHKPDHHVHLAFTGCTADDFLRHATAAGASNVYALPCRNPVDYIAYITRQRMDSSDSRISHSRDITYALRRARALNDDPVRLSCELADLAIARAKDSTSGTDPVPPVATGRALTSSWETNDDHPGTGPDRRTARPDRPLDDFSAGSHESTVGLLLALLADHPGRITITIQLEVPGHVPSKSVPTPADQPVAGSQHPAESADDPHVVAHASSGRRAQPEAAPQAAASARSAAQETRDEETVEEESGPEAVHDEETVEEEMTS